MAEVFARHSVDVVNFFFAQTGVTNGVDCFVAFLTINGGSVAYDDCAVVLHIAFIYYYLFAWIVFLKNFCSSLISAFAKSYACLEVSALAAAANAGLVTFSDEVEVECFVVHDVCFFKIVIICLF